MEDYLVNKTIRAAFNKAQLNIRLEAISQIFKSYDKMVELGVQHYINLTSIDRFYNDEFDRLMNMEIEELHKYVEALDCELGRCLVTINDYYNSEDTKDIPGFPFK
nr:hypothetical protein [uncultured Flavobacterium sp.]